MADESIDSLLDASIVNRAGDDSPSRDALAQLLLTSPPIVGDAEALGLLYACFPRDTANSQDPALLAIAEALVRHFGKVDRRSLTCTRAWQMLDPVLFERKFAKRLSDIIDDIVSWQKTHTAFYELQTSEIDLIELFFETLPPGPHVDLLVRVMDCKILSNRRLGLLRRVPIRARRKASTIKEKDKAVMVEWLEGADAFLTALIDPRGFRPIVEHATASRETIRQMLDKLKPPPEEKPEDSFFKLGGAW